MELNRIIDIKKENLEQAEREYKLLLDHFGEKDERTQRKFFKMAALRRDIPEELKDGRECPSCRKRFGPNSNFCSMCGKAILY